MIWYVYILLNDYHNKFSKISIPSHNYFFFLVVITFKICLDNFQIYNTIPLIIVTMLYIRAPEFINLTAGNLG